MPGRRAIGGFDIELAGEHFGADGYRYRIFLTRTGACTEIELPVTTTPLGAIAGLEHVLGGFEDELDHLRARRENAQNRPASYRAREGGAFPFAGELEAKRGQLAEINANLAKDEENDMAE